MTTPATQKTVALYLRVSTDGQTVTNQRLELEQAAERHGWRIVAEFSDPGVSGAKGRDKRPGLDKLLRAVARREFEIVAAWSVDRMGRSLPDLLTTFGELQAKHVDLYLHQQALDTGTPAGRAMFQMCGVFAEFERAMIQERVRAGLRRAVKAGKRLGRPMLAPDKVASVRALLASGKGINAVAREIGVSNGVVQRIKGEMVTPAPG